MYTYELKSKVRFLYDLTHYLNGIIICIRIFSHDDYVIFSNLVLSFIYLTTNNIIILYKIIFMKKAAFMRKIITSES